VEALKIRDRILGLRVWGYGTHDPRGFRLSCELELNNGSATCSEKGEQRSDPAVDRQVKVTQKN
jgi:hypothetical protein